MNSNERVREEVRADIQPTTLEFRTSQGKKSGYEELMRRTGITTMDGLIAEALDFLDQGVRNAEAKRSLVSVPVGKTPEQKAKDNVPFENTALRFAFVRSLAKP